MKRTVLFGFVLMGLFAGAMALADEDGFRAVKRIKDLHHGSGRLGAYRALVIGIDHYGDKRIPDLKTAVA